MLWIAFRFFIFVLRTQRRLKCLGATSCCELLSDFLSLFFEHNDNQFNNSTLYVVNCFQIFYLCSSNTTLDNIEIYRKLLWIAFRFFIFVLRTQRISIRKWARLSCELLSDFLSLFFEHNPCRRGWTSMRVVNCFQIFYLCSSNTTLGTARTDCCSCELLSDFLSLFFEHNLHQQAYIHRQVVNCFQIFYLCSSNTTEFAQNKDSQALMEIIPK